MFRLGTFVRDMVSLVEGIVESRATFIYGCDRYCVQPQTTDGSTLPDSLMIDECQLEEVAGKEDQAIFPKLEPDARFKPGQVVKDPVTGREGVITGRAVYLNGCARVYIETTEEREDNAFWLDESRAVPKRDFFGRAVIAIISERKFARFSENQRETFRGGPAPSCKY